MQGQKITLLNVKQVSIFFHGPTKCLTHYATSIIPWGSYVPTWEVQLSYSENDNTQKMSDTWGMHRALSDAVWEVERGACHQRGITYQICCFYTRNIPGKVPHDTRCWCTSSPATSHTWWYVYPECSLVVFTSANKTSNIYIDVFVPSQYSVPLLVTVLLLWRVSNEAETCLSALKIMFFRLIL